MDRILVALLLSSLAGLSTTFGSALAFFIKKPTARVLSLGLGFSAGVMIAVSFLEMLPSAIEMAGEINTYLAFFGGMLVIAAIDAFLPHDYVDVGEEAGQHDFDPELLRTGKKMALGIAIHNFPEGLVTFVGTLVSVKLGILLMIAIALHNIPEGISVSLPIFFATKDRRYAFMISFLSGVAEPIGALLGALVLTQFLNDTVLGLTLAVVSGIMIFISFDELVPVAHSHGGGQIASYGVIAGMILMAISLLLLS